MRDEGSIEMRQDDDGTITVTGMSERVIISQHIIDAYRPFVQVHAGEILVTASNGRWHFRPVGRLYAQDAIICQLVRVEHFDMTAEVNGQGECGILDTDQQAISVPPVRYGRGALPYLHDFLS